MSQKSFPSSVSVSVEYPVLPGRENPVALVRLDSTASNGLIIWGTQALAQLREALEGIDVSAVEAVVVTGNHKSFGAGADLKEIRHAQLHGDPEPYVRAGHETLGLLADLPVPTFAVITGPALGGGLELALHCDFRVAAAQKAPLGLPECRLGFFPGWAGTYLLPHIVGAAAALDISITKSMRGQNLNGAKALEVGLVDEVLQARPGTPEWEQQWQEWVAGVLAEGRAPRMSQDSPEVWDAAANQARALAEATWHGAAPGVEAAIELVGLAHNQSRQENAEDSVRRFCEVVRGGPAKDSLYAFELVTSRSRKPADVPQAEIRPIRKVGVIGAGLMAGQLASLMAQGAGVPVVMTDLDDERLATGVQRTRDRFTKQAERGRMSPEKAEQLGALITGATGPEDLADADLVIEAVFEELDVKKKVFAQWEPVIRPDAILATNTSSLSVSAMAEELEHPERLVGFHVFNPVEVTPLVEIIRGLRTDDSTVATAFDLAGQLRRVPVLVEDAPCFVVNRVLTRLFDTVARSIDAGGDPHIVDHALDPMGLPMTPLQLIDFVGPAVLVHIMGTMRDAYPERFTVSPWLQGVVDRGLTGTLPGRGEGSETYLATQAQEILERTRQESGTPPRPDDAADGQLLTRVQDALAQEIGFMVEEGVIASASDVDLCMILGANYPFHLGGITPYLDRVGASERMCGQRFHADSTS